MDNQDLFAEAARSERPDLVRLCLLICAEADVELDQHGMDAVEIELDRLAGSLPYGRDRSPADWARVLAEALGRREGFAGRPADYRRLESSLLHQVLRRRRGLPILLSVVWMEVGRRAGAPMYGVALPGHFVVGVGEPDGDHVLVDPFAGGRPLPEGEVDLLVSEATGDRERASARAAASLLLPADPVEIVLRVLNNIRAWAAARPEHSDVQLWAVDLALRLPHHPAQLRLERAQLLVDRGQFRDGAAEMEEYANAIAAMEPAAAGAARRRARSARARLN
ncbi:transglutaminase-like domain-containing protein [Streptomyces sp. NPDC005438]|uniref:transglutaminase-like domain-containing protein n=1 Tax=Streptomyces sp. NPDC005438 TaxID=3156880 RepID=UPI0033B48B7F